MLSVQNYQMAQPKISFKQNEETKEQTPNSFSTHAGLKTGAAVATAGALYNLANTSFLSSIVNRARGAVDEYAGSIGEEVAEQLRGGLSDAGDIMKSAKKRYYWTIPVTMAVYAGCGALVDKFINDRRADFAKTSQNKNAQDVVKDNKDAELTRNGNAYQKSNIGKKYGAAIGVVALPVLKAANSAIRGGYHFSVLGTLVSMAAGALGGLTLGAITDHYANKGAKKFADIQA